jgi:hypothetical protein
MILLMSDNVGKGRLFRRESADLSQEIGKKEHKPEQYYIHIFNIYVQY